MVHSLTVDWALILFGCFSAVALVALLAHELLDATDTRPRDLHNKPKEPPSTKEPSYWKRKVGDHDDQA